MKILYTLLVVTVVSSIGWTQSYKADYARKLSKELQFADALPIWEELSNAFISKKKKKKIIGDYSFLRMTAQAAMFSEQYEKALHWKRQSFMKNHFGLISYLKINGAESNELIRMMAQFRLIQIIRWHLSPRIKMK